MPIYDFYCKTCEEKCEKMTSYNKKDEQVCSKCSSRLDYLPSFNIGGVLGLPNGFAPTRSKSREKKPIGGADTK